MTPHAIAIIGILYVLACADSSMCGYRVAAGRNALLRKEAYFRRAMRQGFGLGQSAVFISATAITICLFLSNDRSTTISQLLRAAAFMLQIYLPYTALIVVGFVMRLLPSVDFRSLSSTLIFGPLLFIRPIVAICGIAWAVFNIHSTAILLVGLLILCLMLSLERILFHLRRTKLLISN